ncbi:MAG TPA: hypothetical protein VI895_00350, partial [Bdellovibrionota bacterium]|nr:hypothetical protein [Bdellovibrionota bacterium]
MKFTCDSCQHVFEETEGAAATGEVDCPKCGKPVTIGGPREGAVELAGGFDDFFEVETSSGEVVIKEPSTSQGKPSVGKPAPPPPPKTAAPPPPK